MRALCISVLALLAGSCAGDMGTEDNPGAAVFEQEASWHPEGWTASPDALAWGERVAIERTLAERDARFSPTAADDGVLLARPAGPLARIDELGAWLSIGDVPDVRVAVVSVARAGVHASLSVAEPTVTGVEVQRALAPGVAEWWRALPSGLEHGLTLTARPAGEGTLEIAVELEGAVPRALTDDSIALLRDDE